MELISLLFVTGDYYDAGFSDSFSPGATFYPSTPAAANTNENGNVIKKRVSRAIADFFFF